MNANRIHNMCAIRHKQEVRAWINRCKKILLETLKVTWKSCVADSTISQVLLKDFAETEKVHVSVTLAWNLRLFFVRL